MLSVRCKITRFDDADATAKSAKKRSDILCVYMFGLPFTTWTIPALPRSWATWPDEPCWGLLGSLLIAQCRLCHLAGPAQHPHFAAEGFLLGDAALLRLRQGLGLVKIRCEMPFRSAARYWCWTLADPAAAAAAVPTGSAAEAA